MPCLHLPIKTEQIVTQVLPTSFLVLHDPPEERLHGVCIVAGPQGRCIVVLESLVLGRSHPGSNASVQQGVG